MKRRMFRVIISALSLCMAMFFGGCANPVRNAAGGQAPSGIDKLYTAQCEITVNNGADKEELFYAGELCRLGGGFWQLSLTEPETVKGLKICLGENGVSASLGDLNFSLETDKIPSRAAFMSVFSVLDNAAANMNSLSMTENETDLCYKGGSGEKQYTIICNKADNKPCGLTTGNITVKFSSFTVTGSVSQNVETSAVTSETSAITTVPETSVSVKLESAPAITTVSSPLFTTAPAAAAE